MKPGRILLSLLLLALLAAALTSSGREAPGLEEATLTLQAASLAADRDLRYDERDVSRFRERRWSPETRVGLGYDAANRHRFERPWPYPLMAAPFEALAPGRGPLLLNVLLLALAAVLAVRHLEPVMGDTASWLVAAALFGSVTAGHALQVRPDALLLAATVAAFSLAWPRAEDTRALASGELPAMRPREPGAAAEGVSRLRGFVSSLGRWLAAGLLLGAVVIYHPLFALLVPVLLAGVPVRRRAIAVAAVVLAVLAVLVVGWLLGGLYAEFRAAPKLAIAADGLADLEARGASPASGADLRAQWPPAVADYRLHARNGLYLLAGRHIGLVVCFLPVLLVLWLGSGGAPRRRVLIAGAVLVLALLMLFPFDLAGGPAPGNRWLVPIFAALLLGPRRPVARGAAFGFLLAGAALTGSLWMGARSTAAGPAARLLERLPFETTQRSVPVAAEIVRRGVRVRAASAAVGAGRDGLPLSLGAGGVGQLIVAADRPISFVDLEFGPNAVGQPELSGAELEQMVFRPDGGVTFRLRPGRAARHRVWWSDSRQLVHRISVAMPDTPLDLGFGVSVE